MDHIEFQLPETLLHPGETFSYQPPEGVEFTRAHAHRVRSMMRRFGLINGTKYTVWLTKEHTIKVLRLHTKETIVLKPDNGEDFHRRNVE